jgi:hypothetical protein
MGLYTIFSIIFLHEIRRQQIFTHQLYSEVINSLHRQEEIQRDYEIEMRTLIGNVAHDLKTVMVKSIIKYLFILKQIL